MLAGRRLTGEPLEIRRALLRKKVLTSSRFASSLKPNVAYLDLNFCALWKKQTTLPSLAYACIPYQVFGERAGAPRDPFLQHRLAVLVHSMHRVAEALVAKIDT